MQITTSWTIKKATLPIIGVTKVKQVEEAAEAMDIQLSSEEIRILQKLGDQTEV